MALLLLHTVLVFLLAKLESHWKNWDGTWVWLVLLSIQMPDITTGFCKKVVEASYQHIFLPDKHTINNNWQLSVIQHSALNMGQYFSAAVTLGLPLRWQVWKQSSSPGFLCCQVATHPLIHPTSIHLLLQHCPSVPTHNLSEWMVPALENSEKTRLSSEVFPFVKLSH